MYNREAPIREVFASEVLPYVYKAKEFILEIIHFLILIVKVK